MGGSFFGLNVAVNGLFAAQRNLDVINHNLNNINTTGYSRQQAVQTAARPMSLSDGTGMLGTGAEVTGVTRVRDEFLDYKYWNESTINGEWGAKKEILSEIETTFGEPSSSDSTSSGFTQVMNDFYDALQELSKNPSDGAARSNVKETGVTLAKYFNNLSIQFENLQEDVNGRIKTGVAEVNSIAEQIGQLNKQIYNYELDGNTANDLRDQRTVLVDRLSKLINIDANEVVTDKLPNGQDDKHFVVTVSGKALVDHFDVSELDLVQRQDKLNPDADAEGLYDIQWKDGNSLEIKSGQLKGYLDVRDGNAKENGSPDFKGIPFYVDQLNTFVRTFAQAFNEGYIGASSTGGGTVNGYGLDGTQKERFFTMLDSEGNSMTSSEFIDPTITLKADIEAKYDNITAKNFAVNEDILDDPGKIAASSALDEVGNADVINGLIDMRQNTQMFVTGTPEDFMKSLIANLGVDSQQAQNLSEGYANITKQVDSQRSSVSGVSSDEELANLIRYQHTYNSCAKMIQTMQKIYDTLVNDLGVG